MLHRRLQRVSPGSISPACSRFRTWASTEKIAEYLETGHIVVVEELRATIPPGVRQMMAIPTLRPKRAMMLHRETRTRRGMRKGR